MGGQRASRKAVDSDWKVTMLKHRMYLIIRYMRCIYCCNLTIKSNFMINSNKIKKNITVTCNVIVSPESFKAKLTVHTGWSSSDLVHETMSP